MVIRNKIYGRVWRFGDNIDTDQIIPAEYLVTADMKELGKHAFEKVRDEFASNVKKGDIIVAGRNFGCGSSREHAPMALIGAGISCIIAKSFARIFFRNSINIGLPVVECSVEANDGDKLEVDFKNGKIINLNSGREYNFYPMPTFIMNLIKAGGLVHYVKNNL